MQLFVGFGPYFPTDLVLASDEDVEVSIGLSMD